MFILDHAPQPFDKGIVKDAASAIHTDPHSRGFQLLGEGRDLACGAITLRTVCSLKSSLYGRIPPSLATPQWLTSQHNRHENYPDTGGSRVAAE